MTRFTLSFFIVAVIIGSLMWAGFVVWQRNHIMPQVKTLPSTSQGRPETMPKPNPAPTTQPFSAPSAQWKIYRNEKYGFELKYPNGFIVTEGLRGTGEFIIIVRKKKYTTGIEGEAPGLMLTNYHYGAVPKRTDIFQKDDAVDNIISISFRRNNREFEAKCFLFVEQQEMDTVIETCNALLSTLKVTQAINSIDVSNWKTYRNDAYGFEIKYPSSWLFTDDSAGFRSLSRLGFINKTVDAADVRDFAVDINCYWNDPSLSWGFSGGKQREEKVIRIETIDTKIVYLDGKLFNVPLLKRDDYQFQKNEGMAYHYCGLQLMGKVSTVTDKMIELFTFTKSFDASINQIVNDFKSRGSYITP